MGDVGIGGFGRAGRRHHGSRQFEGVHWRKIKGTTKSMRTGGPDPPGADDSGVGEHDDLRPVGERRQGGGGPPAQVGAGGVPALRGQAATGSR